MRWGRRQRTIAADSDPKHASDAVRYAVADRATESDKDSEDAFADANPDAGPSDENASTPAALSVRITAIRVGEFAPRPLVRYGTAMRAAVIALVLVLVAGGGGGNNGDSSSLRVRRNPSATLCYDIEDPNSPGCTTPTPTPTNQPFVYCLGFTPTIEIIHGTPVLVIGSACTPTPTPTFYLQIVTVPIPTFEVTIVVPVNTPVPTPSKPGH
jgi:hypothetical protein